MLCQCMQTVCLAILTCPVNKKHGNQLYYLMQALQFFQTGQVLPTLNQDNNLTVRVEQVNNTERYTIVSPSSAGTIISGPFYACNVSAFQPIPCSHRAFQLICLQFGQSVCWKEASLLCQLARKFKQLLAPAGVLHAAGDLRRQWKHRSSREHAELYFDRRDPQPHKLPHYSPGSWRGQCSYLCRHPCRPKKQWDCRGGCCIQRGSGGWIHTTAGSTAQTGQSVALMPNAVQHDVTAICQ